MSKQDKINFIKEWYGFRKKMCEKHNNCKECPLYENRDEWTDENGEHTYLSNCKYEFDSHYADEIIDMIEREKTLNGLL